MSRATELLAEILGPPKSSERMHLVSSNQPPSWEGELLNVGCGPFYAPGWCNLDVTRNPDGGILPDILLERYDQLPFTDGAAGAVYLGHVLEHVPWVGVIPYLIEVHRVLAPGAPVCVVGPDVKRATRMWAAGELEWEWLEAVWENDLSFQEAGVWEGARHQWNADGQRVARVLEAAGFVEVEEVELTSARLDPFPVVSRIGWQCAVLATKPSEVIPE